MDSYSKLRERIKTVIQLQTSLGIIQWDMRTMIPPRARKQRAEQLAVMSKIIHQLLTDSDIEKLLVSVEAEENSFDSHQSRELELIHRNWSLQSALPTDLVNKEVKQRAVTTSVWERAKSSNNWKLFEPELEKLFELSKQRATYLMEPTGTTRLYDALLDIYEPDMRGPIVTKVFTRLRNALVPLVKKYEGKCESIKADFLKKKVPRQNQKELVIDLVNFIGFDTLSEDAGGRVDESAHPFTSSYFDDTRMTVRYNETNICEAIFGALHEGGHSIQGQSRNPEWKWMFLGEKSSSGLNESQARFVENIIGRSPEFWEYYYDRFLELTDGIFRSVSSQEFVRSINKIKPSKIRITADEMTYALHIIIRFEIERSLFLDKMEIAEIPQVWNEKYDKYLGMQIENDTEGALQDTHWSWGYWGYFPTYVLGNIYSGMILETLQQQIPDWKNKLTNGSVSPTIDWLRKNVHYNANLYNPGEMLEQITGKKLTAKPFINYLENKYAELFP